MSALKLLAGLAAATLFHLGLMQIWPELARELSAAGVSDYSIYLDEQTLTLFAFQKLTDNNHADALPRSPIVQKWWAWMADLMETNPDKSPVCLPLKEVFHLD